MTQKTNVRLNNNEGFAPLDECPFCGGTKRMDFGIIAKDSRFSATSFGPQGNSTWASVESVEVVQCARCGLRYRTEEILTEALEETYSDEYYDIHSGDRWTGEWKRRLECILKYRSAGRLLDMGCGAGFFVNLASGHFDCVGVEVSPYAAKRAIDMYGVDVRNGFLEDMGFDDSYFDIVTMWDVIEHLTDPHAIVDEIARVLAPGGFFCLCTGDMNSWLARLLGKHWSYYRLMDHVSFYNRELLLDLLRASGFEVREYFYENTSWKHILHFVRHSCIAIAKYGLAKINGLFHSKRMSDFLLTKIEPAVPDFRTQLVVIAEKTRYISSVTSQ